MKFTLPTQHVLYFGLQAKKGKIDSAGVSNANIAEIHNQVLMMLGHELYPLTQVLTCSMACMSQG
jgi:hypothetical protein